MGEHLNIDFLEKKHSMKLLYYLNNGPMIKGELCSKVAVGTASAQDRIDDLIRFGLVTEETEKCKPFKKTIALTDKGKKIAAHIVSIEMILGENDEEMTP